jgi:hypothetical protein
MRPDRDGLPPDDRQVGAEFDGADASACDTEAVAGLFRGDPEFIAERNRVKSVRRERLRAEILSMASDAVATLRELASGPDVPPAVRLRASLAILQAADALNAETIGPTSAEAVQSERRRSEWENFLGR